MENYEHNTRPNSRIKRVQAVLGYLTNQIQAEPTLSDHFQTDTFGATTEPRPDVMTGENRWDSEGTFVADL